MAAAQFGRNLRALFNYAAEYRPLNHGSFGTCPRSVLEAQQHWRDQVERHPDPTLRFIYPAELHKIRQGVAQVVGCRKQDLVLVPNATTGTNTILRSLPFTQADSILYFSTSYGALEKTVLYVCASSGATPVKVDITYPITTATILERTEAQLRRGGVKLAVIDTISSIPAQRLPFAELIALCRRYNCLSLIDGAHSIGCIPLNLSTLQPDFFTSNLHKWYFSSRPNALLYVAPEHQPRIHSLPISHGYEAPGVPNPLPPAEGLTAFENEFNFVGSTDVSGVLAIPAATEFRQSIGGDAAIYAYLHKLAQTGGAVVARRLNTEVMGGSETQGNPMVNVRLPLAYVPGGEGSTRAKLERTLWQDHHTFIPCFSYAGAWWARLSAQVYLDEDDFVFAADALADACGRL